ncbi:hypothetical protein SKAU_G00123410 [Synaphobranchus kaupii]|uniref:Secreted protein n=1 Tax=Synaphobranchus kaupii TaxID=118154 RepID=A0A9Q1FPM8_SYNKA|nr:hypothetical protein SKAU_G00123410 [Synaphobranchus kaupii]
MCLRFQWVVTGALVLRLPPVANWSSMSRVSVYSPREDSTSRRLAMYRVVRNRAARSTPKGLFLQTQNDW